MAEGKIHLTDQELDQIPDFEDMMLRRVQRDVAEAIDFTRPLREEYLDSFALYNRGNDYSQLREEEIYPTDFYSQLVNTFTSSMMRPLWAKDEPCKLIPGPNTSSEEVEVKQQLHDFQNREDGLKETHRIGIQDISLHGIGIVKTDYIEETETIWGTEEVLDTQTMQEIDPQTQEVIREFEQPIVDPLTGEEQTKLVSVPIESVLYKGPRSERIDPQNFFFGIDKRRGDSNPVMIRSFVDRDFFNTKRFGKFLFINRDRLSELNPSQPERHDQDSHELWRKREILGMRDTSSISRNEFVYFEWQGLVDKKKLFSYLQRRGGPRFELDPRTNQFVDVISPDLVKKGETVMCVCGMTNAQIINRLDKFFLDHSNIVAGIMSPIDNEMVGDSIGRQAKPGGMRMDALGGIMFKSLRIAVNRGHGINVEAVVGGEAGVPDVNQDAWVLKCTENPNQVHKIIDQPSVARDVYQAQAIVERWTRDRTNVSEVTSGKADPNAETLGENILVAQETSVRSDDPLEMIEDKFIIPIARIRDEINMLFLTDEKYRMEIIGEEGERNWVSLTPDQIRAHTRFMCESSGREENKAVITQQLLQANQTAPNALAAGQSVRLDRMMFKLFTDGFGRSEEEAGFFFPTVKAELDSGAGGQMDQLMAATQQQTEANKLLSAQVNAILLQIQAQFPLGLPMAKGGENGNSPGGSTKSAGQELPQPTNETDAVQSNLQRSQPNSVGV